MTKLKPLNLIIQKSPHPLAETVDKLRQIIVAKGMMIFAMIDHSGEAQKVNMDLNEEKVLLFGDPKVGTFLMQEDQLIGMELPLRLLIWQDGKGITQIAYIDPLSLGESYKISRNMEILRKMSSVLALIVAEAIQRSSSDTL